MKNVVARLRSRPPLAAALLVLLVLLATTDERSFGTIPDGMQMLSAGAAFSFSGEIGVSRAFATAAPRDGGDSSSRYGMGLSLLYAPFFWIARALHAVSPGLPTTPVFALLPILSLSACAWGVARAAANLGAAPLAQWLAGSASILATPLWAYAGSDFSEPLQVALVASSLAALTALRTGPSLRRALLAGALLGSLPLVKSSLWLVSAPLLVVAALSRPASAAPAPRRKAPGRPAAVMLVLRGVLLGGLPPVALWAALDLVRFRGVLGGYPGEGFSHPLVDGLLKLAVYPNKGLLVYAPLTLFAIPGLIVLRKRDPALAIGLLISASALVLSGATWWAWEGQASWGPRLVLPAVPIAVLASVLFLGTARAGVALALALAGALVNLPGALQPFPAVYALAATAHPGPHPGAPAGEERAEVYRGPDGRWLASAPYLLAVEPGWWPPLVHVRLLRERLSGGDVGGRLESGALRLAPPFRPRRPAAPAAVYRQAVSSFSWPFWGRSFLAVEPGLVDPLAFALRDQGIRDLESGNPRRADDRFRLLLEREGPDADPRSLALAADAAAGAGDPARARELLGRCPDPCHPWVLFVHEKLGDEMPGCPSSSRSAGNEASAGRRGPEIRPVSAWARETG
ncbi:MAG TPA: hypothetical protein PLL76_00515 [Thermoanaerobaculia bacterium]|nr:hypothetical protein [Thermoanaerobaculia bacterium]